MEDNNEEKKLGQEVTEQGKEFLKEKSKDGFKQLIMLLKRTHPVAFWIIVAVIAIAIVIGIVLIAALLKDDKDNTKTKATTSKYDAFGACALVAHAADFSDSETTATGNVAKMIEFGLTAVDCDLNGAKAKGVISSNFSSYGGAWCSVYVYSLYEYANFISLDEANQLQGSGDGVTYASYWQTMDNSKYYNGYRGTQAIGNVSYLPQVGDLVLFDWDNDPSDPNADHVGVVYKIEGQTMYTLEGNSTGSKCLVKTRTYVTPGNEYIVGYFSLGSFLASKNIDVNTSINSGTKIFIGDSRTVGMHASVYNASDSEEINVTEADDTIWSAKQSMGLSWMDQTGIPNVDGKITQGSNIIILMGVNDLYNDNNYIEYINKKAAEDWKQKGANVYFVSVNPIDDVKAAANGYEEKDSQVVDFNNKMKAGLSQDIQYIDTYSQIKSSFSTTDGLHYNNETYKAIYNIILQSVGVSGGTNSGNNGEAAKSNIKPILQIDGDRYKIAYGDKTGREAIEEALDDNDFPFDRFTDSELDVIYTCIKAEWATIYPNLGNKHVKNDDEDSEYLQGVITFTRESRKESNDKKSESVKLEYLPYEDFENQLQSSRSNGDTEILKYFTIDSNGNALIATWNSTEIQYDFKGKIPDDIKGGYNNSKSLYLTENAIDYRSMIGIHTEPFELLFTLLEYTEDEDFVIDLANLGFTSDLQITIYENTTETITTQVERTQKNTVITKIVNYYKYITTRLKKQTPNNGPLGPLTTIIDALEEYIENTTVEYYEETVYRYTKDLDYSITTTRTNISNSYTVALSKVDSWFATIDNSYKYNPKLGQKETLDLGTPTDLTNTIEESIGMEDADVQNCINKSSNTFSKTVYRELDYAIKKTEITGSIGLTENTRIVNEYKFEKQELTNITDKIGKRFEEVYDDHKKAQAQFECIDSWIFEALEDDEVTIDYSSVLKYLLHICTGNDYDVDEEDIIAQVLAIFSEQSFTVMSNLESQSDWFMEYLRYMEGPMTNAEGDKYLIEDVEGEGNGTVGTGVLIPVNLDNFDKAAAKLGINDDIRNYGIGDYVDIKWVDEVMKMELEKYWNMVDEKLPGLKYYQRAALVSQCYQGGHLSTDAIYYVKQWTESDDEYGNCSFKYKDMDVDSLNNGDQYWGDGYFNTGLAQDFLSSWSFTSEYPGLRKRRRSDYIMFKSGWNMVTHTYCPMSDVNTEGLPQYNAIILEKTMWVKNACIQNGLEYHNVISLGSSRKNHPVFNQDGTLTGNLTVGISCASFVTEVLCQAGLYPGGQTIWAWNDAGTLISRYSQYGIKVVQVNPSDALPGDIIFYQGRDDEVHVNILTEKTQTTFKKMGSPEFYSPSNDNRHYIEGDISKLNNWLILRVTGTN